MRQRTKRLLGIDCVASVGGWALSRALEAMLRRLVPLLGSWDQRPPASAPTGARPKRLCLLVTLGAPPSVCRGLLGEGTAG